MPNRFGKLYRLALVLGFVSVLSVSLTAHAEDAMPEGSLEDSPQDTPESATQAAAEGESGAMTEAAPRQQGPGHLEPWQHAQQALAEASKESERLWLELSYPQREDSVQVLALQQAPRTAHPHGAVLLLHDIDQHADWPGLVHHLRTQLPDSGWHTLALNLPLHSKTGPAKRTLPPKQFEQIVMTPALAQRLNPSSSGGAEEAEGAAEAGAEDGSDNSADAAADESSQEASAPDASENESSEQDIDINLAKANEAQQALAEESVLPPLPYADKALEHIKAGMDALVDQGFRNIAIVAVGHSAHLALAYLKPDAATYKNKGLALILVAPHFSAPFDEDIAEALGEQFKAPVLDLVDSSVPRQVTEARMRQAMARRAETENYTQVRFAALFSDTKQKSVLRRIDAWLERYAPGMAGKAVRR